ncbi:hypothetical protein T08_14831 [Trichinella sp. T8]|nr:hypothetical protein T08_14831 [Trichinella sp. T8]
MSYVKGAFFVSSFSCLSCTFGFLLVRQKFQNVVQELFMKIDLYLKTLV